jgi:hypothetical protein
MITNEKAIVRDSSTNVEPPITGSPIIIGGGGGPNSYAFCKFKPDDYTPRTMASGRTKFVSVDVNRYMQKLTLKINNQLADLSAFLNGASNDNSVIEIMCNQVNDDLKFEVRPLAVEFNTGTYKPGPPDAEGLVIYQSAASLITLVRIRLPGLNLEREFGNESCEVLVDYVPPPAV